MGRPAAIPTEEVEHMLLTNPALTAEELAEQFGVSLRSAQRVLARVQGPRQAGRRRQPVLLPTDDQIEAIMADLQLDLAPNARKIHALARIHASGVPVEVVRRSLERHPEWPQYRALQDQVDAAAAQIAALWRTRIQPAIQAAREQWTTLREFWGRVPEEHKQHPPRKLAQGGQQARLKALYWDTVAIDLGGEIITDSMTVMYGDLPTVELEQIRRDLERAAEARRQTLEDALSEFRVEVAAVLAGLQDSRIEAAVREWVRRRYGSRALVSEETDNTQPVAALADTAPAPVEPDPPQPIMEAAAADPEMLDRESLGVLRVLGVADADPATQRAALKDHLAEAYDPAASVQTPFWRRAAALLTAHVQPCEGMERNQGGRAP